MAKIQMIVLNAIAAAFIAVMVMGMMYVSQDIINYTVFGMLLLGFAYIVLSIISIFKARGLVKRQDEEKLKKSASVVKLGAIFFWIVTLVFIKWANLWGIEKLIALGILYITLL